LSPIFGILDSSKSNWLATLAWDSIATYSSGSTSVINFNTIPQTYKHLRVVARLKDTRSGAPYSSGNMTFNGVSTGYPYTYIFADSRTNNSTPFDDSTTGGTSFPLSCAGGSPYISNGAIYGYSLIDIYDYSSTSKTKTIIGHQGFIDGSSSYSIKSQTRFLATGLWNNTSAITSIAIASENPNFTSDVRVSLYGIKG
jgi:hypothetical protein